MFDHIRPQVLRHFVDACHVRAKTYARRQPVVETRDAEEALTRLQNLAYAAQPNHAAGLRAMSAEREWAANWFLEVLEGDGPRVMRVDGHCLCPTTTVAAEPRQDVYVDGHWMSADFFYQNQQLVWDQLV